MAIQKTEAIILKTQPFRSSSLIITFFSKSFGKLRGLAKGVRQERETRGALFELFTHVDIVFYEKQRSDLHLVSEASILESYPSLRTRLESIAYASYFSELVDELSEVHDPHEGVFDLLDFSFRYLASLPGRRLARLFEIKLVNEIGWLPHLTNCLLCGKSPLEEGYFSSRQGGLLCPHCYGKAPDSKPIRK
ncbi:MAG: DNA repair protein RecO, partial [Candidatus Omnitrophica bacterium]|nr:DNA repair protein RecO [Candidatus Omnitrophota bacterium]